MSAKRTAFYISDGTGITAEALGRSLMSQFEGVTFHHVTLPYVNNIEEAERVVAQINSVYERDGAKPLIIATLVNEEVGRLIAGTTALYFDVFASFIGPIEQELHCPSNHRVGRSHGVEDYKKYQTRIDAIDFTLATDDGGGVNRYNDADLILLGVSRCGKTPTSLYLALQHGLRVANYPITDEDMTRGSLPQALLNHKSKLFGLMIDAQRLQSIREERKPGSNYAQLNVCQRELRFAENMFLHYGIKYINSTHLSIEEIATKIVSLTGLKTKINR